MANKRTKKESQEIIVLVTLIVTILGTIGTWLAVPGFRDLFRLKNETTSITPSFETNANQTIYDLFPTFLGTKWKYQTSQTTETKSTNGEISRTSVQGEYSQTITSVFTGLSDRAKIIELKIEGENYQTECTSSSLISGDSFLWYVMDENSLYIACSKEAANQIAGQIVQQENTSDLPLPEYIAPLKLGTKWSEFSKDDTNNFDTSYVWYVESIVPVTVQAGKYNNCYRILLYTNPDTTVKYVCPNIGLVSFLYSHNGSVNDYSVELVNYSLP